MTLEIFVGTVTVLCALFGGYWTLGRMLIGSYEKRLDERFTAQDKAREEGKKLWAERFDRIEERQDAHERDLTQLMRDLPTSYVRREDAIRENTTINAKLDALNSRLEHVITLRSRQ